MSEKKPEISLHTTAESLRKENKITKDLVLAVRKFIIDHADALPKGGALCAHNSAAEPRGVKPFFGFLGSPSTFREKCWVSLYVGNNLKWADQSECDILTPMAKRASQDIKRKKSRSRKTAKRLGIKRAMLAARGVRRNSVQFGRAKR